MASRFVMINKYALFLCSIVSVFALGACATAIDKTFQDITFLTPDAQDAKCYAYVDKLKYQIFPPQTVNIKKSNHEMKIVCHAPGNRMLEMYVPVKLSAKAIWGGPPGIAWDYASRSLHSFPSVIAIDFSKEALMANKKPQHNNSDIKQPEDYNLGEVSTSQPRLNSDRYKVEQPILRRGETSMDDEFDDVESDGDYDGGQVDDGASPFDGNADLQSVINDLTGDEGVEMSEPAQAEAE